MHTVQTIFFSPQIIWKREQNMMANPPQIRQPGCVFWKEGQSLHNHNVTTDTRKVA